MKLSIEIRDPDSRVLVKWDDPEPVSVEWDGTFRFVLDGPATASGTMASIHLVYKSHLICGAPLDGWEPIREGRTVHLNWDARIQSNRAEPWDKE